MGTLRLFATNEKDDKILAVLGEPMVLAALYATTVPRVERPIPSFVRDEQIGKDFEYFLAYHAPVLFDFVIEQLKGK